MLRAELSRGAPILAGKSPLPFLRSGPATSRMRRSARLLVVAATMLPVLAFAGYTLTRAYDAYRAAEESRLQDTARALAAGVEAQLQAAIFSMRVMALAQIYDGVVDRTAFAARVPDVAAALGGAITAIGRAPGFPTLAHTHIPPTQPLPQTTLVGSVPTGLEALRLAFDPGEPVVSDLFDGPIMSGLRFAAAVPVVRSGGIDKVLALSLPAGALQPLLSRQDLPRGTFATILDGRGRVIAHTAFPNGERTGHQVPDWLRSLPGDAPRRLVTGANWTGEPTVYALERVAVAPGWQVMVGQPAAEQGAAARQALGWVGYGVAALLAGLLVAALVVRVEGLAAVRREAAALRAGRDEVQRLLSGLPAVLFLREVAPDGSSRLLFADGDVEAVVGWPREAAAALADWDEVAAPGTPPVAAATLRALRHGHATLDWQARQPDGDWTWMRTQLRRLREDADGGGEVVGTVVNTERERTAEARAIAAARLASLGEMAAGLAHELKQPLQVISLAAENAVGALDNADDRGARRRLDRVVDQASRAGQIIENLRRFARGSAEPGKVEPVAVADAVNAALGLVGSALRHAQIAIVRDIADPSPVVLAARVPLEQVLVNLLANARDALDRAPHGAAPAVRLRAERLDDKVRITVSDNGGGIPAEVLPRLFEPFVTTKAPDRGTGLGLAICHGLVGDMGGSIEAHNDAEGAVFVILLPAAPKPGA